jgi:hypothetical protein
MSKVREILNSASIRRDARPVAKARGSVPQPPRAIARLRWAKWALCCALLAVLATGCSTYRLQGKVVKGDTSAVRVVDANDPGLDRPPLGGVELTVTLDPRQLDHKRVGSGMSGGRGQFSMPIDALGAGFLEHQVQVAAVKEEFETATRIMPLPARDKRLLIVMTAGKSKPPPKKGAVLDETLEMSEPYMHDPTFQGEGE